MRKSISILLITLLIIWAAACSPSDEKQDASSSTRATAVATEVPEKIVMDVSEAALYTNDTIELKASGAENVVWYSSDPSVASVDEKGVV